MRIIFKILAAPFVLVLTLLVAVLSFLLIGLYLAREIVTLQGGYIRVTSEVGRGSTFSVFLPRQ